MVKKEETNDIVQYLLPKLEELGIKQSQCKIDVTTEKSGKKRGDIWISTTAHNSNDFESNILALIEAKHRNSTIGDIDWRDAMSQGKEKSRNQGLDYYIVSNCKSDFRFYNTHNDEEIRLDDRIITKMAPIKVLKKINTQISDDNSYVVDKATKDIRPLSEAKFRGTLKRLADIYRSAGLSDGDPRIDPTISLVVLKYISENEAECRTLHRVIELWDDLHDIACDNVVGDLRVEFEKMIQLIWENPNYSENIYKDFKNLITIPKKLQNEHLKKVYIELDSYHFHGANFDLYGSIYEEFASQAKKKQFGEFYTRRHITGLIARLVLSNEKVPRDLKICDPACGTGGFLTEAYKTLLNTYSQNNRLNASVEKQLKTNVFFGYDNDNKSVARTKLNMFLVGDGHVHIYEVKDSLISWLSSLGWSDNTFDYILTNPPMGKYEGNARVEDFLYTNEKKYELLFFEKVVDALKPGAIAAIITNDGALEAPSRERFRINILKQCRIHAIISLTKFAFAPYTKEKTYVVLLQKKQEDEPAEIQTHPIWHFILDYDGYANSDKRFKTKYHDDIPELEEKYPGAIGAINNFMPSQRDFHLTHNSFERKVNAREELEGLHGYKYKFVDIANVNNSNYHNLLSEFHLRPEQVNTISESDFDKEYKLIISKFQEVQIT